MATESSSATLCALTSMLSCCGWRHNGVSTLRESIAHRVMEPGWRRRSVKPLAVSELASSTRWSICHGDKAAGCVTWPYMESLCESASTAVQLSRIISWTAVFFVRKANFSCGIIFRSIGRQNFFDSEGWRSAFLHWCTYVNESK